MATDWWGRLIRICFPAPFNATQPLRHVSADNSICPSTIILDLVSCIILSCITALLTQDVVKQDDTTFLACLKAYNKTTFSDRNSKPFISKTKLMLRQTFRWTSGFCQTISLTLKNWTPFIQEMDSRVGSLRKKRGSRRRWSQKRLGNYIA